MAFTTTCPHCSTRLKSAAKLPAGKRITCASCQRPFTLREDSPSSDSRSGEEDVPDAELLDDEPAKRPAVRRRRLDEDDDLDDRPRSRRRARVEEDDGPPRKSKRKKKVSPILLIAAGGSVLLIAIASVVAYFAFRGKPGGNDLLVYAPSDTVVVSGYDIEQLAGNEAFRKALEKKAPYHINELDRAGLRTADIASVMVAQTSQNGNVCAIRFKTAPDKARYLEGKTPAKASPFRSVAGTYRFGYFPADNVLVLADRENALQSVIDQGGKERLTSDVRGMITRVSGPVWRASGRTSPADRERFGGPEDGFLLRMGNSSGSASWLTMEGPEADVRFEIDFEKREHAGMAAAVMRQSFALAGSADMSGLFVGGGQHDPEMIDMRRGYAAASVVETGTRVTGKLTLPPGEAMRCVGSVRY